MRRMKQKGRFKRWRENIKKIGRPITYKMQDKIIWLFFIFFAFFIGVAGRLFYIDSHDGDRYTKQALSQQTYITNELPYRRGTITDRKGVVLAESDKLYNLILEPAVVLSNEGKYTDRTLALIEKHFGLEDKDLRQILEDSPDSYYKVLLKEVSYDDMKSFKDEALADELVEGYSFEEVYKRDYPLKDVASHVIGYTNDGNDGTWGIEQYYNSELNGRNGKSYGYFNSEKQLTETVLDPKNGLNVVSTIDADVQAVCQKIIQQYMKEEGAENVGILVMDPNNGEIFAMASDKEFDLNNPRDLTAFYSDSEIASMKADGTTENALNKIWRNYCISDMYEPGSTFKPFTVSACLDEKAVAENSWYTCDGGEQVADTLIHCVNRNGHGNISLEQSLEFSCNDVMMQISRKLGRTEFARYQSLFGLGSKTGIDLPGEAVGMIYDEEHLNPVELATSSFGQGVSVTMLQMAAGFSSIMNGGTYYKPHIVKELTNDAGLSAEKLEPVILKKTVSAETSDFIKNALYKTVEEGTGKKARVKGYKIAGKTGTAQKIDKDENGNSVRSDVNYVVSFIGCAPYDNPQAVVYVVIDEPHVELQQNCASASVLAGRVIKQTFPLLGIYPDENADNPNTDETVTENEATIFGTDGTASGEAIDVSGAAIDAGENGVTGNAGDAADTNTETNTEGAAGQDQTLQ